MGVCSRVRPAIAVPALVHQLLQRGKGFHGIGFGGGDLGKQSGADRQFDAIFQVDSHQANHAGRNSGTEATSDAPEDGTFACA